MSDPEFRFLLETDSPRLDRAVADHTERGRRAVRQWFEQGRVRLDGWIAAAADSGQSGSEVTIDAPPLSPSTRLDLAILFENPRLVVVDKPAGMHSEKGKGTHSVADALEHRYGNLSDVGEREAESGLVHRLDQDTSGLLVAARDREMYQNLRDLFRGGGATKGYLALVLGRIDADLDVDSPLRRSANRMVAAGWSHEDEALPARTFFEPLEATDEWSLVSVTMRTGVMHQIRAHAAHAGHPLIGDTLYDGPELPGCRRRGQLLHAFRVRIGTEVDICVGPPGDFLEAYALLQRRGR